MSTATTRVQMSQRVANRVRDHSCEHVVQSGESKIDNTVLAKGAGVFRDVSEGACHIHVT